MRLDSSNCFTLFSAVPSSDQGSEEYKPALRYRLAASDFFWKRNPQEQGETFNVDGSRSDLRKGQKLSDAGGIDYAEPQSSSTGRINVSADA